MIVVGHKSRYFGEIQEIASSLGKDIYPVFNVSDEVLDGLRASGEDLSFVVAVGNSALRRELFIAGLESGLKASEPLIHKSASISGTANLSLGTHVNQLASVGSNTTIGMNCQVNRACSIGHDVMIDDHVSFGPNATVCGGVFIGTGALIGAGSVILPSLKIGNSAVVGAGAVVTKDVPEGVTVVGNPAKPVPR